MIPLKLVTASHVQWSGHAILMWLVLVATSAGCSDHRSAPETARSEPPPSSSAVNDSEHPQSPNRLRDRVSALRDAGELDKAVQTAYAAFLADPDDASSDEVKLLVAEIEVDRNQPERAIELLEPMNLRSSPVGSASAQLLTRLAIRSKRFGLAESTLRTMAESDAPGTAESDAWIRLLWQFLQTRGRLQEASLQADELCRRGTAGVPELLSLINRNEVFPIPQQDRPPSGFESRPAATRARWHLARKQFDLAARCLWTQQSEDKAPANLSSPSDAALFLRIAAERQDESGFLETLSRHRNQLDPFADYWCGLGTYWIDRGDNSAATGALLRAIEIDPTMRIAYQRLSRSCAALGRTDDSQQFRHRGVEIAETETIARRIEENPALPQARSDLARRLLNLGRPLEALQWTRSVLPPDAADGFAEIARQRQKIITNPEHREMPSDVALLGLNPSDFPVAEPMGRLIAKVPRGDRVEQPAPDPRPMHPVELVNVAAERGADFQWYHDRELELKTIPLYESVGGGIATFDMDLDGWPDLYFAQGGGRPEMPPMSRSNELRRNLDGFFVDVTRSSQTEDRRYSAGMAAGDVNQDGFPDLYVGAIGENRLLINQGDGTFRDETDAIKMSPDFFTASVAIADLNADTLPELFEVNYIEMEGAFARPKKGPDGQDELPSPLLFYPQADRVFWSEGNGEFKAELIEEAIASPATGLGIVISNFDTAPGNEAFVGNDLRDNHFLRWINGRAENSANAIGIANGATGLANGCMGIATGDFDGNGTLDLHVGNYRGEADNLFLQSETGIFRDEASRRNLSKLSLPLVAFGSKTVDFDGNGSLDLAVTNGHIFDMRSMNQGYKMKPHLLLSDGFAFHRQSETALGEYWGGNYLGRSMAMIDFDRDLRTDLIIGHLDAPTALLQNRTAERATRIHLELVGTRSERDATGARVTLLGSAGSVSQWVTAGDGYYCTDENCLDLSLGDDPEIRGLEIHWPKGDRSRFDNVAPGLRYLAIEGCETLFPRTSSPGE